MPMIHFSSKIIENMDYFPNIDLYIEEMVGDSNENEGIQNETNIKNNSFTDKVEISLFLTKMDFFFQEKETDPLIECPLPAKNTEQPPLHEQVSVATGKNKLGISREYKRAAREVKNTPEFLERRFFSLSKKHVQNQILKISSNSGTLNFAREIIYL
jgi:hypothetical protein